MNCVSILALAAAMVVWARPVVAQQSIEYASVSGRVTDTSGAVVGGAMSLADIALACNIGFINARRPEFFPQEKYPGLAKLWKKLEERDTFRKTPPPPA